MNLNHQSHRAPFKPKFAKRYGNLGKVDSNVFAPRRYAGRAKK